MHRVVLAMVMCLAACSADREAAAPANPSTCGELQQRWHAAADDPSLAERIQAEYRGLACYDTCGHLSDPNSPCRPAVPSAPTSSSPPSSSVAGTPVTAPPFPSRLAGYAQLGTPTSASVRAFDDDTGSLVHEFPVTMNGCGNGLTTTRWRSVGGPVTAAIVDFVDEGAVVRRADIKKATTGVAGLLVSDHQCEQPVFFTEGSGLVDIAIEYQSWRAAP